MTRKEFLKFAKNLHDNDANWDGEELSKHGKRVASKLMESIGEVPAHGSDRRFGPGFQIDKDQAGNITFERDFMFGFDTRSNYYEGSMKHDTGFKEITDSISRLLEYKNEKYGDAVLSPLEIFSDKAKAGQRIDDKLSRIKNSTELRKNDVSDLIGYLIIVCKEKGWSNFDEFMD